MLTNGSLLYSIIHGYWRLEIKVGFLLYAQFGEYKGKCEQVWLEV